MITDTWRPNFLLPETILTLGKRQYNITPTSTTHMSGKDISGKHMSSSFVAVSWIQSLLPRFAVFFSSLNFMIFVSLPKKQPLDLFAHPALHFDIYKCETLCSKQFIILHSLNFLHSFKTILQSFKTILHSFKSFYICSKLVNIFLQEERNTFSP